MTTDLRWADDMADRLDRAWSNNGLTIDRVRHLAAHGRAAEKNICKAILRERRRSHLAAAAILTYSLAAHGLRPDRGIGLAVTQIIDDPANRERVDLLVSYLRDHGTVPPDVAAEFEEAMAATFGAAWTDPWDHVVGDDPR